jgi:hypothetical protein
VSQNQAEPPADRAAQQAMQQIADAMLLDAHEAARRLTHDLSEEERAVLFDMLVAAFLAGGRRVARAWREAAQSHHASAESLEQLALLTIAAASEAAAAQASTLGRATER